MAMSPEQTRSHDLESLKSVLGQIAGLESIGRTPIDAGQFRGRELGDAARVAAGGLVDAEQRLKPLREQRAQLFGTLGTITPDEQAFLEGRAG